MIVVVAPGQGSQAPGMLTPWLDLPGAQEHLERLGAAAGLDLVRLGTEGDAGTLRRTEVAQPLIVAAGLLAAAALDRPIRAVAGHSVGEITAAVLAGILGEEDGMRLIAERGRAMAEAAALAETGMSAVIGGDEATVVDRIESLGLVAANRNGGGQIVASGPVEGLAALRDEPPAGARVIPLQVAGAFHSPAMLPARDALRSVAGGLSPADPAARIWSNSDGGEVARGAAFLDLLVGQVASPVRWDRTMESFTAAGITGLVELAPAGTLVGLAKRAMKGVPTVAVKAPADLDAARAMIDGAA